MIIIFSSLYIGSSKARIFKKCNEISTFKEKIYHYKENNGKRYFKKIWKDEKYIICYEKIRIIYLRYLCVLGNDEHKIKNGVMRWEYGRDRMKDD